MTLNPVVRLVLLAAAWVAWALALLELRHHRLERAVKVDRRARWGLVLEMAGYVIVTTHGPGVWSTGIELWRAVAGTVLALISIGVFWTAVASLGRQWRFDAGLNRNHELVQTGPYRFVRHPIYASMLGMLLTEAFLIGTWPGWLVALVLFLAGTEIRIHVEDALLRERFGERFVRWQRSVRAYVPYVR